MLRSQLQLQTLQVGTNFCCRLITCDKVLSDSFMDEVFQLCWKLRIQIAGRSRCLSKDGVMEPVRNLNRSIQQRLELKRRLGLRVCFRRNYVAQRAAFK